MGNCTSNKSNNSGNGNGNGSSNGSGDDLPHVFKSHYKTGEILGEGAYAKVKLAIHKKTNQKCAVKIVDKANISEVDKNALLQEVSIMKRLHHNHVVRLLDFFDEEKFYYLVLEYMDGGELFSRIVKKTVYNEKEARDCIRIIIDAIKYCHDQNVVHRDLKPENLLLSSKDDDADLKLADFGFAEDVSGGMLETQCGTPGYIAPEILENRPYGRPVDMWSIGVIAYILLGGYPPFHDDNMKMLFKKIRKGAFVFHPEYWNNVSDEAKDMIKGLLTVDPSKRLTAAQVLQHPWMKEDDSVLAAKDLGSNLEEFKKFNAARKFKSAAKAVMAINRMKNLLGGPVEPLDDDESGKVAARPAEAPETSS